MAGCWLRGKMKFNFTEINFVGSNIVQDIPYLIVTQTEQPSS